MYETTEIGQDTYCRCHTAESFEAWCKDGGWKDAEEFERDTGVAFEELQGEWFDIVDNRVFLR